MRESRAQARLDGADWVKAHDAAQRRRHLLKYGLTPEQYQEMFDRHDGACWLCGRTQKKRLSVDHDHVTNKVRGLLCNRCNTVLGWLEAVGIDKIVRWLEHGRT